MHEEVDCPAAEVHCPPEDVCYPPATRKGEVAFSTQPLPTKPAPFARQELNEEDLYAGIEHQQTQDVVQCLKLITRPGCEKIVRYAFEYAKAYGRKKVTCMVKDNIMKLTDGLFHNVFKEIAERDE